MRAVPIVATLTACVALAACSLRLGGPGPEEFDTVALYLQAGTDATQMAQAIRTAGADIVLLSAPQDSAWFARVSEAADLDLSGPGTWDGRAMAFLTDMEILGDTSLVLEVPGGGRVLMHDALYEISQERHVDLMMVRFTGTDLRAAVRTLLGYIATDVGSTASLILAVDAETPQAADSAAALMRATLANARDCRGGDAVAGARLRLLYGPSARVTCQSAGAQAEPAAGVSARLQVR